MKFALHAVCASSVCQGTAAQRVHRRHSHVNLQWPLLGLSAAYRADIREVRVLGRSWAEVTHTGVILRTLTSCLAAIWDTSVGAQGGASSGEVCRAVAQRPVRVKAGSAAEIGPRNSLGRAPQCRARAKASWGTQNRCDSLHTVSGGIQKAFKGARRAGTGPSGTCLLTATGFRIITHRQEGMMEPCCAKALITIP
jgi:hypothetical protein